MLQLMSAEHSSSCATAVATLTIVIGFDSGLILSDKPQLHNKDPSAPLCMEAMVMNKAIPAILP